MPSYRVATRNGTLKGRWDNLASSECHNSSDEETEESVCEEEQERQVVTTRSGRRAGRLNLKLL